MSPLALLQLVPWKLVSIVLLVIGIFFSGAYWQKDRDLASQLARAEQQVSIQAQASAREIFRNTEINAQIVADAKIESDRQDEIRNAALNHLKSKHAAAQEKINALEKQGVGKAVLVEVCSSGDLYRLDHRSVGLLNAASGKVPFEPTGRVDEKGSALTDVGAEDLAEHTFEITKLYQELATRHDGLVDWITDKQKELAK